MRDADLEILQYEPKLEKSSWQKRAQDWVEACSNNCSAVVIVPDGKDDTTIEGSKPYVELRANRDIYSEDLVLYVQTISNVTTSTPEQVEARRRAGILDHYYCNACASLLAVPQAYSHEFQTAGMPAEPDNPLAITIASSTTGSSQKPNHSTRDHPSTGASILKFCRPSHMVPTCSANCRKLSEDFDKGICQTTIERRIRHSHLNEFEPRTAADHNTQCLRDLIFLRLITNAINLGESPLQCDDLKFATTGPNMRGIENSEMECWSFVSHVVNPIRCLRELFKNSNRDQFSKLSQVDGWIIYTLLVKINRAMRIHKGPRYVKRFQADGTLDAAFGPWDKRWEGPPKLSKEQEDKSIWIASIDSLFNMIRIADPAKGETPNVAVIQKEGVHVYAVKADGGLAIKAGEPLLRAADGVEGPVVDERLYARGLPEWMEETEDGEELHSGDTSEFLDEFSDDDEEILGDVDDEDELGGEAMEE